MLVVAEQPGGYGEADQGGAVDLGSERALALTATGFMLNADGDQARAQTLFEQSLPLYRRSRGKLRIVLTALGLGILGQLAARRRDYSRASELLGQSQALLHELDDDDFTGYGRLQYLMTTAVVDDALGQVRLGQGDHDTGLCGAGSTARLIVGLIAHAGGVDWCHPCARAGTAGPGTSSTLTGVRSTLRSAGRTYRSLSEMRATLHEGWIRAWPIQPAPPAGRRPGRWWRLIRLGGSGS